MIENKVLPDFVVILETEEEGDKNILIERFQSKVLFSNRGVGLILVII